MIETTTEALLRLFQDISTRLRVEREGATAVEYGLMVALIAAVIITAVTAIGTGTEEDFTCVAGAIAAGQGTNCP